MLFKNSCARPLAAGLMVAGLLAGTSAVAGTLGEAPPRDKGETAQVTESRSLSPLSDATVVATEIFGGTVGQNARRKLTDVEDIWFALTRRQLSFAIDIDLIVDGAEYDESRLDYTATPKQRGYYLVVPGDATATPPTTEKILPVYRRSDTATSAADMDDLEDILEATADTSALTDFVVYDTRGTASEWASIVLSGNPGADTPGDVSVTIGDDGSPAIADLALSHFEAGLVPLAVQGTDVASTTIYDCDGMVRNESTVRFRGCLEDVETTAVYVFHITGGLSFVSAQGLAEAGNTVTLAVDVRESDDRDEVVDTADAVALYESANSLSSRITNPGRLGIDPFSDPAFSRIVNNAGGTDLTAPLGTIAITEAMGGTTDGAGGAITTGALISSATITVSHGAFSDDAFRSLAVGPRSHNLRPTADNPIEDDSISFTVRPASSVPETRGVVVTFDGETAISSWDSGSASVSFAPARGAADANYSLPNGASGSLAALSRGGLSTEINMAQSSSGDGATRYQSWVRIANNGASDGSVTVMLHDAETGDFIGAWDSPVIPANGSIQVSVSALEDNADHIPHAGQQYNIMVDGSINGYVQHVMWNTVDGLFSDLSGFRAGGGLNTEP